MKKKILLAVCLLLLEGMPSFGQNGNYYSLANAILTNDSAGSDKAWARQPRSPRPMTYATDSNGVEIEGRPLTESEKREKAYRRAIHDSLYVMWGNEYVQWGFDFWQQYPGDTRRYKWLINAVNMAPVCYFPNIRNGLLLTPENVDQQMVDVSGWVAWQQQYDVLKKEFISDPIVTERQKYDLLLNELYTYLSVNRYAVTRQMEEGFNLETVAHRILSVAPYFYQYVCDSLYISRWGNKDELSMLVFRVFDEGVKFYKNKYEDIERFLRIIEESPYERLNGYAKQLLSFMALRKGSIQLKHASLNGRKVNLRKLRGKVVLLDFWSLSCGFCIGMMPEVKKVHEKYRMLGFEVISVACNPEIDQERVTRVHEMIGADWPLLLIGGKGKQSGWSAPNSLQKKIWRKYGFQSVPQLLLLDREGKLAAYNETLLYPGGLEKELVKLLVNEEK